MTLQAVAVGIFVWSVVQHLMKGGSKYAEVRNGVLSVLLDGEPLMLKWSVDSWDLKHKVCMPTWPY